MVASFGSLKLELGNQMPRLKRETESGSIQWNQNGVKGQPLEVEKYSSKGEWSLESQASTNTAGCWGCSVAFVMET